MSKCKHGSKTQQPREPEQLRSRVIFARVSIAFHEAVKEVAARAQVSLSVLAEDALSQLLDVHNPNKPRTIVTQMTVVLHEAAKEVAARLKMSPDQFMEYALLQAVELHTPTQGTANDEDEETAGQKTGVKTQR